MIMGAAKQAVAKKVDKRARKDLKEAMGNVAGAMGGGTGVPPLVRTKYKSSTVDRSWKTAIKNAEQRRRDKKKFSNKEQMPTAPSELLRPHDSPKKRVKSDLNVSKIDLSTKPTKSKDNSPNALEIASKKNKAKQVANAIEEGDTEKFAESVTERKIGGQKAFYRMQGFPRQLVGNQKNLPEFLKKEILDAPAFKRYNSETMEVENLKPLNRTAMQMTGREGDVIPMMRMHGTPYKKQRLAGKAKIKKTAYGQTGKAISNKNLIQPVYKKIYKDK